VTAPHDATLVFEYDDPHDARIVERSLRPEVGEIDDERSRATVTHDGATVTVRIEAADLVALRAALNTWCSFVDVAERTAGCVDRTD
jgi:KEOPS complex subunit Pcc1